ncbi:guanine nucleotide-binding protein G(I)/G(S)/G(O) subunit gamma-13-like [Brachyhypopomus gauderio]|uniref:guanine nucleotide-binding protein G(I)/G(S)/G(O) subunit gamma-13-like n=1 Tax=Brachyhypopomus gauderio TaxID=698409 RepID=UPI00404127E4
MDELDESQLRKEVDSRKMQLQIAREKCCVSVPELVKWIEEKMSDDPFLNAELLKDNPWVESGKCIML